MNIDWLLQQTPALPTVPDGVQKLIQTLNQDDVPLSEIARILSADQVLCAKVLRLANSAYYSAPRTISTVKQALRMLGLGAVRTLVVSTSMAASFKPIPDFDLKRFWIYSLHTAVAAKYLARRVAALSDVDLVFTVGLLHGIGWLVKITGMANEMKRLSPDLSPYPGDDRIFAERSVFGFTYADVGADLVRRWNFPDRFAEMIAGAASPPNALQAVIHIATWRARRYAGFIER